MDTDGPSAAKPQPNRATTDSKYGYRFSGRKTTQRTQRIVTTLARHSSARRSSTHTTRRARSDAPFRFTGRNKDSLPEKQRKGRKNWYPRGPAIPPPAARPHTQHGAHGVTRPFGSQ